jgi:hypothetical protein
MQTQLVTHYTPTGPIIDLGPNAAKAMPPGHRHRYRQEGTLTMADGSTERSVIVALTKPKLADAIQRRHESIARQTLHADYLDGDYCGLSQTFYIGPPR